MGEMCSYFALFSFLLNLSFINELLPLSPESVGSVCPSESPRPRPRPRPLPRSRLVFCSFLSSAGAGGGELSRTGSGSPFGVSEGAEVVTREAEDKRRGGGVLVVAVVNLAMIIA